MFPSYSNIMICIEIFNIFRFGLHACSDSGKARERAIKSAS